MTDDKEQRAVGLYHVTLSNGTDLAAFWNGMSWIWFSASQGPDNGQLLTVVKVHEREGGRLGVAAAPVDELGRSTGIRRIDYSLLADGLVLLDGLFPILNPENQAAINQMRFILEDVQRLTKKDEHAHSQAG